MPVSPSTKEKTPAIEPGPETPKKSAPEFPAGHAGGGPDFLRLAASPGRLEAFERRPTEERERLVEAGKGLLRAFEPHVQRWSEVVGEAPPNTPFPVKPWPALLRPYALDCIFFALVRNKEGCFGGETTRLLKTAVDRCVAHGLPPFVRRTSRRSYAGSAVVEDVMVGRESPLGRCPLETLLENPAGVLAQAVRRTFDTLATEQIDLAGTPEEATTLDLQQRLRDRPGDYLRVETASEIEGWYSRLPPEEWSEQREIGRARLERLECQLSLWGAAIGEAPPNFPLAVNPWAETVAWYAKDAVAFLFRCEATACLGRKASEYLDRLVRQMADQGLPPDLEAVEQAGFARFAIGRYLLGDPGKGAVLSREAKIEASDPVASVEAALADAWMGYSDPNGLGAFLAGRRMILNEWRRDHPRRPVARRGPEREAVARAGALNEVWGLGPVRCLKPVFCFARQRTREQTAAMLATIDDLPASEPRTSGDPP